MKIYINSKTINVLSKLQGDYKFNKAMEVKQYIMFDVVNGMTKRIEYFNYNFDCDYFRFECDESEVDTFEKDICNVIFDLAFQFSEKKVIEDAFNNKVILSYKIR